MTVVSVLNYKGGVGKTTVTANLGADLAFRGRKVLLMDLDPQASLTFSFYRPDYWEKELAAERTILKLYDSFNWSRSVVPLRDLVVTPPMVDEVVRPRGGRLDLVPSHLKLVDAELDLASSLGGSRYQTFSPDYPRVHRLLADQLQTDSFREYDFILIDCAPNFNMVTRTAVVASDHILVPAKADNLSTLGITYLRQRLSQLVEEYNGVADQDQAAVINPVILGVVFTMVQYAGPGLMLKLANYIRLTGETEVTLFSQTLRESKKVFADSGGQVLPAVLAADTTENVQYDLQRLTSEFIARIRT